MKSYIWTLPTRIFHWLLVIAVVASYFLSDEESTINFHVAFGLLAGGLAVFRVFWGFFGPKHSRFKDFPLGLRSIIRSFKEVAAPVKEYAGHNPLASLVMLAIVIDVLAIACSGILLVSSKGNFIPALSNPALADSYKEIHEAVVNLLFLLIGIHLLGIIIDFIQNARTKKYALPSMFTGRKNIEGENAKLNTFQKVFFILMLSISLLMFIFSAVKNDYNIKDDEKTEQHED